MLKKRSRPVHRDQNVGQLIPDSTHDSFSPFDFSHQRTKNITLFSVPGLFIRSGSKALSQYGFAKSPTSPLDFKGFSNTNDSFGSPRPCTQGRPKGSCNRVGLGIISSLQDEDFVGFSNCRNILLSSQMRISILSHGNNPQSFLNTLSNPKFLHKECAISPQTQMKSSLMESSSSIMGLESSETKLEMEVLQKPHFSASDLFRSSSTGLTYGSPKSISDSFCANLTNNSLDSPQFVKGGLNFDTLSGNPGSLPISIASDYGLVCSLSASEIELSEDYTRVVTHGPNPKTTHIFGDCILETNTTELGGHNKEEWESGSPSLLNCLDDLPYPSTELLTYCSSLKKLEGGKDVYAGRCEKSFCSRSCCGQEIFVEEEMEKHNASSPHSPNRTHASANLPDPLVPRNLSSCKGCFPSEP